MRPSFLYHKSILRGDASTLTENMANLSLGQGKTAVSALQEMMQKRSAPVPVYKEKGGVGPPFTIVCQVDQLLTEVKTRKSSPVHHLKSFLGYW